MEGDDYIVENEILNEVRGSRNKKKKKKIKLINDDDDDDDDVDDDDGWMLVNSMPGGPSNPELLRSFCAHVAYYLWMDPSFERGILKPQNRIQALQRFMPQLGGEVEVESKFNSEEQWYQLAQSSKLTHLHHCMFGHLNMPLISSFVERWHPETNSFHMSFGEMTITLHDVALILGLDTDGYACYNKIQLPSHKKSLLTFIKSQIDISWDDLEAKHEKGGFKNIDLISYAKNSELDISVRTRSYLVHLLGSTLFTDKTSDRCNNGLWSLVKDIEAVPQYSWATGVLAYLYRQLGKASRSKCKQLSGCLTLLQCWIYEYFPMFRDLRLNTDWTSNMPRCQRWVQGSSIPKDLADLRRYRRALDALTAYQIIWMPYGKTLLGYDLTIFEGCIRYGTIIEPYMPDRVLRQFGYAQSIPSYPIRPAYECRPSTTSKYVVRFDDNAMTNWANPRSHVLNHHRLGLLAVSPWDCESSYVQWFSERTHPQVQNPEHLSREVATSAQLSFKDIHPETLMMRIASILQPLYPHYRETNFEDGDLTADVLLRYIDEVIGIVLPYDEMHRVVNPSHVMVCTRGGRVRTRGGRVRTRGGRVRTRGGCPNTGRRRLTCD